MKGPVNPKLSDTMIRYVVCIIVLLIELSYRQDKRMDELNLFIDYYPNTLFQSSEQGMSLLFTCPVLTDVSWAMLLSTGSCKNTRAHYVTSPR